MIETESAVRSDETFNGTWPFQAHYSDAAGFPMHYIDEGKGPDTLLLMHGEPTWSYLFRQQVPVWAAHHRVIAIDHMGFGKSATPPDRTYWLRDHVDNLECFVRALDLRDLTLVMHDFGGPVGMGLAVRHPDRIKRLVSINGPTPAGQPDLFERLTANAAESPWFQWVLRAEREGILDQVLGQLDFNILSTLKLNGFERNEVISETWLQAYRAPFPTAAHAVGAIGWAKGFATGMHQFETPTVETQTEMAKKPALAIWGEADRTLHSKHFLPLFTQAFPNGHVHRLTASGHYSPEDAPGVIASLVNGFLNTNQLGMELIAPN